MSYLDHLNHLVDLPETKKEELKNKLLNSCPLDEWHRTMPASVDPKMVLIGVSPGNSKSSDLDLSKYESKPSILKTKNSNFYLPDSAHYWDKLRILVDRFFNSFETMTTLQALSLTSHFNLGTDTSGSANVKNIRADLTKWVSQLLNEVFEPDVVILFGLKSILKNPKVYANWNHDHGLKIDWTEPDSQRQLNVNTKNNYKFSKWNVINSKDHDIKVVLWPNHPSKHPFSTMENWKKAVDQFVSNF